jgi:zinc transport system permease protein
MRVVGLLLVSALMIVPVAVAQLVARSFTGTMAFACTLSVGVSVVGLGLTYWYDLPPGSTIVVLAIGIYAATVALRPVIARHRRGAGR